MENFHSNCKVWRRKGFSPFQWESRNSIRALLSSVYSLHHWSLSTRRWHKWSRASEEEKCVSKKVFFVCVCVCVDFCEGFKNKVHKIRPFSHNVHYFLFGQGNHRQSVFNCSIWGWTFDTWLESFVVKRAVGLRLKCSLVSWGTGLLNLNHFFVPLCLFGNCFKISFNIWMLIYKAKIIPPIMILDFVLFALGKQRRTEQKK